MIFTDSQLAAFLVAAPFLLLAAAMLFGSALVERQERLSAAPAKKRRSF